MIQFEELLKMAEKSERGVILVAPFIKENVFRQFVNKISKKVPLRVYTRWRPEEIASGVSDLEVWEILNEREKAEIFLCHQLHAKCYVFDQTALVGSANLTARGLGVHPASNLEFLVELESTNCDVTELLQRLDQNSILATKTIYEACKVAADLIISEVGSFVDPLDFGRNDTAWLPHIRYPEQLYQVYINNRDQTTAMLEKGGIDLEYLRIGEGLNEEQFNIAVRSIILQTPFFSKIYQMSDSPRRFGEYRDFTSAWLKNRNISRDSSEVWQTAIRWILFFLGTEFSIIQPNYSEILIKKKKE